MTGSTSDIKRLIAHLHLEHATLMCKANATTDATLFNVLVDDAAARTEDIAILNAALDRCRQPEWTRLNCAPSLYAAMGKEAA